MLICNNKNILVILFSIAKPNQKKAIFFNQLQNIRFYIIETVDSTQGRPTAAILRDSFLIKDCNPCRVGSLNKRVMLKNRTETTESSTFANEQIKTEICCVLDSVSVCVSVIGAFR